MLRRVGVRELRNQVTAVLHRAEGGERVVVTVAGRPVAQLGPLDPLGATTIDDLAARGAIVPARRTDRPPPELVVAVRVGTRLDRLLAEVRA